MSIWRGVWIAVTCLALAGCSTTVPQVEIDAFSGAVADELDAAESLLDDREADRIALESEFDTMAARLASFDIYEDCAALGPLRAAQEPPTRWHIADRCRMVAFSTDPDSDERVELDLDATDAARMRNARAALRGLRDYAAALGEIAAAKSYGEIVENFTAAGEAMTSAADTGASMRGGGLGDARIAVADATLAFASKAVESAVERMRATAIRDLVIAHDETVHGVTQVIAAAMYRFEKEELDRLSDQFEVAWNAQSSLAARRDKEALREALEAFHDARSALEAYDRERHSLRVLRIGLAHQALAESYREVGDPKAMIRAQIEILDLIEAGEELEDALKDV